MSALVQVAAISGTHALVQKLHVGATITHRRIALPLGCWGFE